MNAPNLIARLGRLFLFPILLFSLSTQAQSLSNVQRMAVYYADKVKIDGKALELNNTFQAYNKAIDCFYTLSNDESNLHLTIQVRMPEIISKVLMGGITLTISPTRDKKNPNCIQAMFPVLEEAERRQLTNMVAAKVIKMKESKSTEVDVADLNDALSIRSKNIHVNGLGIPEQNLSIYNEEGLKAAAQFDSKMFYTFELELPLKYIKGLQKEPKAFKYNIQVNGPEIKPRIPGDNTPPPPPMELGSASNTDFWADYTLAKKL